MSYEMLATSQSPALIIYVLDVSGSMSMLMDTNEGRKKRVEVVTDALYVALQQMVFRSTKGGRVSPRYRLAMFAYSNEVYDVLGGIKTIDQVAAMGVPELQALQATNTAEAFAHVEKLLQSELPNLASCPAPLVCHMTDGEYNGDDPEPIIRRIMNMGNPDGNVLVENIFISERILPQEVESASQWAGVALDTPLRNKYARRLRDLSSPIPASYRVMMLEQGYQIGENALMLLPGESQDLIEMGFAMSMSTPTSAQ
jgi:hypothetical protein